MKEERFQNPLRDHFLLLLVVRAFIEQILASALQSRWSYQPGSISCNRRCRGRWLGRVWPHSNWDLNLTLALLDHSMTL